MKPVRLHHVGIIMTSMERAEEFMEKFGLEEDYKEYVEAYHAWCIFTKYTAKESPVELVVPTEGVLTEFNKGKGGIHHIAFEVEDVKQAREDFEAKGMEMLEETPAKGAGNIIVNFLRPRYGLGVLVEFVEKTNK
ncbi:MAG: VOC family protein [Lachnospiraceae bacterium]|jgi:methylmalonyl-CoA/ethylmalonyl-CoA epimerase|nr:VOC family protein [Lachnospiraceae bacterium]MDD3616628.1 VOC family protein [Lachnospiraceae bacterium]